MWSLDGNTNRIMVINSPGNRSPFITIMITVFNVCALTWLSPCSNIEGVWSWVWFRSTKEFTLIFCYPHLNHVLIAVHWAFPTVPQDVSTYSKVVRPYQLIPSLPFVRNNVVSKKRIYGCITNLSKIYDLGGVKMAAVRLSRIQLSSRVFGRLWHHPSSSSGNINE